MKFHNLAPVLALLLSQPTHAADTPSAPPLANPEALATIDPKALKLLAQVAEKYAGLGYYAGLMDVSFGEATKLNHERDRLSLGRGNTGIIAKVNGRGTERWSSDGRVTRATATWRPKQYIEQPLNASSFWKIGRDEFYERAGFQGILQQFLAGRVGGLLLEPDLHSLTVEPTAENGATQKITVAMVASEKPDSGFVDFFVAADLSLRRATMHERVNNQPDALWDEIYSETVMAKEIPAGYYESITLAPLKGYKRVETFDPSPSATPPVNNTVPKPPAKPAKK